MYALQIPHRLTGVKITKLKKQYNINIKRGQSKLNIWN